MNKTIKIKSMLLDNTCNELEIMEQKIMNELNKVIAKHESETGLIFDSIQFNESTKSINIKFKELI